jgi:hypothetical protein
MYFKKISRPLSLLLFLPGILFGWLLMGVAAWGDIESVFYGFDTIGGKPLSSLKCPILMTAGETAKVSITIKNPTKKTVEPLLRADVSHHGVFRQERTRLPLDPGETRQFEWTVTQDDVSLGFFILFKAYTYAASSLPFREASCGILFLEQPGLTGSQILVILLAFMLLGIIAGLGLWQYGSQPMQGRSSNTAWAMRFLAGVVLAGVLTALMGWLLFNLLLLILSILLISVFIFFVVSPAS